MTWGPNWNTPSLRPLYTLSFLPAAKPTGRRTVRVVVFLLLFNSDDSSASDTIQRWDPETRLNFFSLTLRLHTPSLIIL